MKGLVSLFLMAFVCKLIVITTRRTMVFPRIHLSSALTEGPTPLPYATAFTTAAEVAPRRQIRAAQFR